MSVDTPDSFATLTGTATFAVLSDGRSRSRSASVTVVKPPWGSSAIVYQGGVNPTALSLTVYIADEAHLGSLEDRVGEVGTLVYAEGTLAAVLEDTASGDIWGETLQQKVRCKFTVTG